MKDWSWVGLSICCCKSCCIWWRPLAGLSIIWGLGCAGGGPPGPWLGFGGEPRWGACGLWCGLGCELGAPVLGCCDCCVMIGCFCWVIGAVADAVLTAGPLGLSFPLLWYSNVNSDGCCCGCSLSVPEQLLSRTDLSRLRHCCCCCCFNAANNVLAWKQTNNLQLKILFCLLLLIYFHLFTFACLLSFVYFFYCFDFEYF